RVRPEADPEKTPRPEKNITATGAGNRATYWDKGRRNGQKKRRAYFPSPARRLGHWIGQSLRRYPFFEQQSASDCGAASLVMIARYWGKRISVNRLREMANVNRDGASLKGLITAAEN
ncbi:MAG: cysteine peptidase family C39 domain-containing protein, partial [Microcystis panniformis]